MTNPAALSNSTDSAAQWLAGPSGKGLCCASAGTLNARTIRPARSAAKPFLRMVLGNLLVSGAHRPVCLSRDAPWTRKDRTSLRRFLALPARDRRAPVGQVPSHTPSTYAIPRDPPLVAKQVVRTDTGS